MSHRIRTAAAFCATFQGPQEDRAIDEAQFRHRHLPAGQRLRHRDPRHHDDAAVLGGAQQQSDRQLPLRLSLRRLGQRRDVMSASRSVFSSRPSGSGIGSSNRRCQPPAFDLIFTVEVHSASSSKTSTRRAIVTSMPLGRASFPKSYSVCSSGRNGW